MTIADAVEMNDASRLGELLAAKADVNAAQADGMTAVHWAVLQENVDTLTRLIEAGALVDEKTVYGVTALSIACTSGNAETTLRLLDAGADANKPIQGGETPLMTASRTGKVGVVELLLARGADVKAELPGGQMAIHWAADEGHAAVVQSLIKAGADPSAELSSGFNPLICAAREGHREAVKVLLNAGVDIHSSVHTKGSGRAPRSGMTALMFAVENGHFELAIDLVKAGANPNDDASDYSPLHVISWVRKPNRGDDPDGDPPPYGSGEMTSLEFVKGIVSLGADVNKRINKISSGPGRLDKTGATPFLLAADTADVPLMRTLVELGADTNATNETQTTPLLAAAGVGTFAPGEEAGTEPEVIEAIQYVLELGGDINAVDKNGDTAMHGAAYKGTPKVVDFLATHGAKIDVWNRENKHGWTPLSIAEGYRHGNFRPLEEMVVAIEKVMRAQGVEPVPHKMRSDKGNTEIYLKKKSEPIGK